MASMLWPYHLFFSFALRQISNNPDQSKAVPVKANKEEQLTFWKKTLPSLLEEVKAGKAEIYYTDGT